MSNQILFQEKAPVYDALVEYHSQGILPLHTPGHKGTLMPSELSHLITPLGLNCDLPSMDATDNWFHPTGCIAEAQKLAADLYGAADSYYLINGSTIGVQSMLLAALSPGDTVLMSRYSHMSAFSALVLSGGIPVYLPQKWSKQAGPIPITEAEIEWYLHHYPDIKAVFLVHSTYYGVSRSLAGIASRCHEDGIPLLIDEAHGAHFNFLYPNEPKSALYYGADLVVQSAHKTLGSLVGTAQIHRNHHSLISHDSMRNAINLLQSTSSNYLLLASLDLTRRWMWREGVKMFQRSVEKANILRHKLNMIEGIKILSPAICSEISDCHIDPLRLTINVADLNLTGFQVEKILYQKYKILCEFSDKNNVIFVLSPPDEDRTYAQLEFAFFEISKRFLKAQEKEDKNYSLSMPETRQALTPREATLRDKKVVVLSECINQVSGETITLYPPGIPLIHPGEVFNKEIVNYLEERAKDSISIFCSDPSLKTVLTVV